mgnify:CR=1 FL=1|jgi:hypothetical protein
MAVVACPRKTLLLRGVLPATLFFCLLGCSSAPAVRVYPMGGRAEAGPLVYSVLEAHWLRQLGEGPTARIARDRFLLLRVSVTNGGPGTAAVPLLSLIAPDGTEYRELTDGEGVADWLGVLRRVEPVDTITGYVLFDVPRSDFRLRVSDDAFDPEDAKIALIDIPLRLEASPDFLPPGRATR